MWIVIFLFLNISANNSISFSFERGDVRIDQERINIQIQGGNIVIVARATETPIIERSGFTNASLFLSSFSLFLSILNVSALFSQMNNLDLSNLGLALEFLLSIIIIFIAKYLLS